ncbi:MAG: TPM domain-containing protein [Verrucomicrobiota bacterium]|nr:TPM domain-containing protein [Verrucomicrobiota bacterium]
MRTHEFLSKLDHDRIVRAIAAAETKTSGQIRVYVQRGNLKGDALAAARKQFHKLGMQKTKERNAVLILVAPRARKFAVVGDAGVHQKCGEVYWQRLVDSMREHFQSENFTQALLEAIEQTGELLAQHFPREERGGRDELPNEIIES